MRTESRNGDAIARSQQSQQPRVEYQVRLDENERFPDVLSRQPERVDVVRGGILAAVDAVNLQSTSVCLQVLTNLIPAMPHDHDESFKALLDQAREKPPKNGDPAHFGQALRETRRSWQEARSRTGRQQEGRGDMAITLRVRRESSIAARSFRVR